MKTLYNKFLLLLLMLPATLLAQSKLSGIVTDKKLGEPLPGVNVLVKGTTNGVSTGFDGGFILTNLKQGDIITFSFLGFTEQTITFTGQNNITIGLQEESSKLDEVVVIGYGSVKKKDATGSVDLITTKDFNKGPVVSVDQLLTGKAPGVRITTAGGAPDSAPNIRIRGGSSLSAQNNPLIVIDGVPIDLVNAAGNGNPLSLINPNDIDTFSILKDASATAIYGSRASNGVIIITTKKGTTGKPEFNFSSSIAIGNARDRIKMMGGPEFTEFVRTHFPNQTHNLGVDDPSTSPVNDPNEDNPLTPQIEGRILSDTNWQDAIYQNSVTSDNNFSARANLLKKIPFRASVGYTNAEGLVKTNEFERVTTSLKLTPTLFDNHLKIDINAKGSWSEKNAIDEGGVFGGAINMDPTKPLDYFNVGVNNGNLGKQGSDNPLSILYQRERPEQIKKLLGNIEFDYKLHFFPEIRAVVNLGLEASRSKIREVYSENAIQSLRILPSGTLVYNPGENYRENQHITNKTLDSYLVYTKELNGFLKKFDVQGGYSYQSFKNDGNKVLYQYNNTTGLREVVFNPQNPTNRYYQPLVLESFFGRANVDLANKYLFTFSYRADGSSLFKKEKRWGHFPAAAFAWKVSEESFLKENKIVNNLKLRLGWGKTGQQDITGAVGYFPSTPLFNPAGSSSQYLPGFNSYSALPFDPNITWEKTTTYNAGLDFGLFSDIVSGSLDVYKRKTTDLLVKVPTLPGQGLSNEFVSNIGSTEGEGAEASLNIKPIKTDNFSWDVNGNLAFTHTEVTDLKGRSSVSAPDSGLPIGTGVSLAYHPLGNQPFSAWVFEQVYDSNGLPIEGTFVDRNNDNQITAEDRIYKAMRPNWTFGFGTTFTYKNIDLSASFRGQVGGLTYNARAMQSGNANQVVPVNSNALTNILSGPILFQDNNDPRYFSDYFLEDASFLRCENITLGYRVNNAIKNGSLRLYVAANNLFLVTKYSGQDPENFNAIDNNFYPRPQVFSFGVNANF
ncbi:MULTISPECIES: SusC/RagA family TonB-linked outer membrane protein [Flavobacterium]|nr:SusC/RagA family TonB-linked outer membrane protein [Flavobacterium sp. N1846]